MKFSGKICLMIVTKNQGFTLSVEDTSFEKPRGVGGAGLGLKSCHFIGLYLKNHTLSVTDMLYELPYYNELNIVTTSKAFKEYLIGKKNPGESD